jgi:catechol 2,3-dioxygenase-like lactoylglutathione lyase family enzyme
MLSGKDAVATVAVGKLDAARRFYEGTLGLKVAGTEGEELITFESGGGKLFVYRSQFAGTNRATAVTWVVGNEIDTIVRTLKAKGVVFEHYDLPGMLREGDVHVADGIRAAWFKDPDGNILSIVNG